MPLPDPISNSPDPDRYKQAKGGGKTALLGLPFLLVGIGVIVIAFIPPETRGGDPFPIYVAIPFGGIFACVGGAIVFGRQRLAIDRKGGTVVKSWGLLSKTLYSKRRELSEFDRISLRAEIRRSDKSTYTVYPIRLQGQESDNFTMSESRKENDARKEVEDLAKFLGFPIHDEIGGGLRVRDPDTLDQSLKEKFAAGKESNEIPEAPLKMVSRVDFDGSSLSVVAPGPGLQAPILLAIAALAIFELIFLSVFAIPMISGSGGEGIPVFVALAFSALFLGIPTVFILFILNKALGEQRLVANRQSLEVIKGWIFKRRDTLTCDRLEECYLGTPGNLRTGKANALFGPSREIVAVSDDKRINFGKGLDEAELEYLLALAKGVIVS